jgi:hypothetical protein
MKTQPPTKLRSLKIANWMNGRLVVKGIGIIDHTEHGRARGDEAPKLDAVHLRCRAVDRRAQLGVIEIALCLIERRLGLEVRREFFKR